HLGSADGPVRTEAIIRGRIASLGDPGRGQGTDICFELGAVVVDEGVPTGWTQPERPNQESRHLATADGLVGAESVVQRWVASESYPGCRQPLDLGLEHGPVVVEEPALPSASQTLRVVARPPHGRRLVNGVG